MRPSNVKPTAHNAFSYVPKPVVSRQRKITEVDRIHAAVKEGRATPVQPIEDIFKKQSMYEAKWSPGRQNLIQMAKERRQERVAKRLNNSMNILLTARHSEKTC